MSEQDKQKHQIDLFDLPYSFTIGESSLAMLGEEIPFSRIVELQRKRYLEHKAWRDLQAYLIDTIRDEDDE